MQHGDGQQSTAPGGPAHACEAADGPVAEVNGLTGTPAGRGHVVRDVFHPGEAAGHAPLAPVQDADHHLLAHVAALVEADGPRLDAGFEGDGVLVHVDAEAWPSSLDACDFQ